MTGGKKIASVLWRRLNAEGSDVCHVFQSTDGWSVSGTAVFMEEDEIAELHYEVTCDLNWVTQNGIVRGTIGERQVDLAVSADVERNWVINGEPVPEAYGCGDLDLNFTPATNLIQFRRLRLSIGSYAEIPVAWLSMPEFRLQVLPQMMTRINAHTYDYAAETVGYAGRIETNDMGIVLQYPQLWTAHTVRTFR